MARLFLFVLVFIVLINLLVRYVLPWRIRKMANKMQNDLSNQQKDYERSKKKEGEVTIENNNPKNEKGFKSKGEYVDYEEVDD